MLRLLGHTVPLRIRCGLLFRAARGSDTPRLSLGVVGLRAIAAFVVAPNLEPLVGELGHSAITVVVCAVCGVARLGARPLVRPSGGPSSLEARERRAELPCIFG